MGCHHPRFTAGPDVIGRAGYSFDASLAVDNPGYVYYAVIPSQTFLSDLDPGYGLHCLSRALLIHVIVTNSKHLLVFFVA